VAFRAPSLHAGIGSFSLLGRHHEWGLDYKNFLSLVPASSPLTKRLLHVILAVSLSSFPFWPTEFSVGECMAKTHFSGSRCYAIAVLPA
jgi:hypothetical protein